MSHVCAVSQSTRLAGISRLPGPPAACVRALPGPGRLARVDPAHAQAELVRAAVGLVLGVEPKDMLVPRRCRARICEARQTAMYLTHVVFGHSHTEIGRLFLRDRTTSAHACKVIEDRRDDPVFDADLQVIESALGLLPRPASCVVPRRAKAEQGLGA